MNALPTSHPGVNLDEPGHEADRRAETTMFGFWLFLMSDAVIFALLLATYGVMLAGTAGGPGPSDLYHLGSTALQTGVLLVSSFTFGLAALAMKYREGRGLVRWLLVTLVLGLCFLALEARDFADMFAQGAGPARSGYLSAFFALVPTHGLHVLAGSIWIVVMLVQLRAFGPTAEVKIRLLRLGLFWHFLDIVWVAIFTVVYLQGLII